MNLELKGNTLQGVFFTEAEISSLPVIKHILVEISRQNSSLTQIKEKMALEVKSLGGNAVMNFKYGQKAHKGMKLLNPFKWDTESWYGEGDVVIFNQ